MAAGSGGSAARASYDYRERGQGDSPGSSPVEVDATDARYDALYDDLVWDNAFASADDLALGNAGATSLGDSSEAADSQGMAGGAHFEQGSGTRLTDPSSALRRLIPGLTEPNAATYVVIACLAALLLLMMLGGVLTVGDHLAAAHPVLAGVFYLVVAVLVVVGIVWPVVSVARRPVFSLYQLRDEEGHAKRRRCQMLVDNMVANAELSPAEITEVKGYLERGDEADDLLIEFFERTMVPRIDAQIRTSATTAFAVNAISHSALVDTVTMLSICLDLVRNIVEQCGFRPTRVGLMRLYGRVMASALVAGGLEDSDLDGLIGTVLGGGAGARVGGILLGSATEGLVSAFLVFRVGVITKDWLCSEDGPARMDMVRRSSYGQALTLMRTSGFMQEVTALLGRTAGKVGKSVAKGAADAAAGAGRSVVQAAQSAGQGMADAAQAAVSGVSRAAQSAGQSMAQAASAATDGVWQATQAAGQSVAGAAQATMRGVAQAAGAATETVRQAAAATGEGFVHATEAAVQGASHVAGMATGAAKQAVKVPRGILESIGRAILGDDDEYNELPPGEEQR